MKRAILILLAFTAFFVACNDNDEGEATISTGKANKRVKCITGENSLWGKYRLEFSYLTDGRLKEAWRTNAETGDTTGTFSVRYDVDYFLFTMTDYYPGFSEERIEELKQKYPDTYLDTLREGRSEQKLCEVELKDGKVTKKTYRPRQNIGGTPSLGYNVSYVHVADYIQIPDPDVYGELSVIRCYDDVFDIGGNNSNKTRTLGKYDVVRTNGEMTGIVYSLPDYYTPGTWKKTAEMSCATHDGVLTSVDGDNYKMRHGAGKAVVAEPGKTTTYVLDGDGLATSMKASDGATATFEYEAGSGNFYELFTLPLDRVLGKVWIR